MKKVKDMKKLNEYLDQYHIRDCFSDPDLPFELYSFEKGEFLNNELDPFLYFSFVVSGTIRILHIREDGSVYEIASGRGPFSLGDMEFGSGEMSPYLVEVIRKTFCISLPLEKCRTKLENDPAFLRYLLRTIAEKMMAVTASLAMPKTLSEKVIHYMQYECPNQTLVGVERASYSLSCSKRQLLRILKQLCEEGIVEKTGRGTYHLLKNEV